MYRLLLAFLTLVPSGVSLSTYTLLNTWPGGFQAELCITNKMNVKCGWTVAIDFNPKISTLDIWNVHVHNVTDMTRRKVRYIVTNLSYNQQLKWNKDLCLGFVARYNNTQIPNIRKLNGKFLYRCRVPTTPAPSTTATTVTSQTTATTRETTSATTTIPDATTPVPITSATTSTPETSTPVPTTSTTAFPETTTAGATTSTTVVPETTTPLPTTSTTVVAETTTAEPRTSTTVVPETTTPLPTTSTTVVEETTTPVSTTSTTAMQDTTSEGGDTTPMGVTTKAPVGRFDYKQVLELSILFYEAQRSGKLPTTNRVSWRGDSALGDKGDNNEDLTGGWYDAGDHIKFTFPMSAAVTYLLLGLHQWKDAYVVSNQLDNMYDSVKWPLDYFLKSWNPQTKEFYVQVGKASLDHAVWGRAEAMTMERPAYKVSPSGPGSDVAAGTAAAMAIGAIVFQSKDEAYSSRLLTAASSLYSFAKNYLGKYSDTVTEAREFYGSDDYNDELALAAVWLYRATGQQRFLTDAEGFAANLMFTPWAVDWSDKSAIVHLALYEETKDIKYRNVVTSFMTSFLPGGSVEYTPCGLAWRLQWGSLRYTANVAMFALLAADAGIESQTYRSWALGQVSYMLGENNYGLSYVVGYGNNYPLRPHHQNSACGLPPAPCDWGTFGDPAPNVNVLKGALVGGPNAQDVYTDDRADYISNEVACDYNGGMQSAVAGLLHLEITHNFPVSSLSRSASCNQQ